MKLRFPEPRKRPLSPQAERACAITMGAGLVLLGPAAVVDGTMGRNLLTVSAACLITVLPPMAYQIVQGFRWVRRTAS